MIIGLMGKKGSGKDTVAAYLIKEYGFERRAFADPLKKSVAALFDIPFHKIDQLKNEPQAHVVLHGEFYDSSDRSPQPAPIAGLTSGMSFREFLQRYGTESHRDVFGENFWLDYTLPLDGYYPNRKIVVTDCRFENEAHRIRQVGGHIIKIERSGLSEQDPHRSEEDLPEHLVDEVIINDSTFNLLYDRIELVLEKFGSLNYKESVT